MILVHICSLVLSDDPGVFLLKEMTLITYLLYVLMAPQKNDIYVYSFFFAMNKWLDATNVAPVLYMCYL